MDQKTVSTIAAGAEMSAELAALATGNAAAIPLIQLGAALLQSAAGAVQNLLAAYASNDPDTLLAAVAQAQHANDVLMGNVDVPADTVAHAQTLITPEPVQHYLSGLNDASTIAVPTPATGVIDGPVELQGNLDLASVDDKLDAGTLAEEPAPAAQEEAPTEEPAGFKVEEPAAPVEGAQETHTES